MAISKSHKSRKSPNQDKEMAPASPAEVNADTGVPQEKPADQQWWFRKPDSKARKLANKIIVHREAGRNDKEIAKLLKTTEQTVRQTVYLARKNGWLDPEMDEPIDVEAELAINMDRKIIRNANAIMDGRMTNWQTFELTKEGLKGRGMFKNHEKSENTQQLSVVAIQVVMPPIGEADQRVAVSDANVGGVPAYIEGEVDGGDEVNASGPRDLVRVGN